MPSRMSRNVLKTIVPALLVIGFALRYYATTTTPLTWHECHIVGGAERISLRPGAVNLPHAGGSRHPPGQLYLARLGTLLLGFNIVGVRFMSVVLGTATCWIIFALVRRAWGAYPAVWSLGLLTFNGYHIGVSSDSTERNYLFFAALTIYVFWRALDEDRPWLLVAAGAVMGVGGWVAENTYFVLPPLALYVALSRRHRHWLKRRHTYAGVLLAVALFLPYIYLNLKMPSAQATLGDDYAFYQERIGRLGLSPAALALYISPLYYKLSKWISVEPVMSLVSGAILLSAIAYATVRSRDELSKMLLVIFWTFFIVFSLLASDRAEFRWAAPSLFAAVPLAGRAIHQLLTRSRICVLLAPLPLAYMVGFAMWTANVSANCYYSPIVRPGPVQLEALHLMQGLLTGAALQFDFPRLLGSPFFPARYRDYYLEQSLRVAMLADRGWIHPGLMGPSLERAALIDPDHPALGPLMEKLEQRGAEDERFKQGLAPGEPVFLREPLALLGLPRDELLRELRGMQYTYTWPQAPPPTPSEDAGAP